MITLLVQQDGEVMQKLEAGRAAFERLAIEPNCVGEHAGPMQRDRVGDERLGVDRRP